MWAMRNKFAHFFSPLFRAIAMSLAVIAPCVTPSIQAAAAPKVVSRAEHRWFVFLGGSSDKPMWTVCRGGHYRGLPPLYVDQIGSLTPIVEAALGVQQIVASTNIETASVQAPEAPKLISPSQLSAEALSTALLLGVRRLSGIRYEIVLELQPSLDAIFCDVYLSGYSDRPAVLCVLHQSQGAKLRLIRLTQKLVKVAELMRGMEQNDKIESSLNDKMDVAKIEAVWQDSIFKPHGIEHAHLHIWDSLSTIEVVFTEDVPFAGYAKAIAGMNWNTIVVHPVE